MGADADASYSARKAFTASSREGPFAVGSDSVLECAGTQESIVQAIKSTRPGGYVG